MQCNQFQELSCVSDALRKPLVVLLYATQLTVKTTQEMRCRDIVNPDVSQIRLPPRRLLGSLRAQVSHPQVDSHNLVEELTSDVSVLYEPLQEAILAYAAESW